jgi:hypothetical protein
MKSRQWALAAADPDLVEELAAALLAAALVVHLRSAVLAVAVAAVERVVVQVAAAPRHLTRSTRSILAMK